MLAIRAIVFDHVIEALSGLEFTAKMTHMKPRLSVVRRLADPTADILPRRFERMMI